ncbi:MAG TPA: hypothetical protein VJ925_00970 [Longimicrobiales bacterium]|nr:hypothetical protein [Longimicrobiales bacterium]
MTNRSWSACLALLGLIWMPSDAAACAIAVSDEDDECAEYVWGYTVDGVRVSGERLGAEGEMTESSSLGVGVGGIGAEADMEGGRSFSFSVAMYELSDGTTILLNCVTYEPVTLD